MTGRYPTYTNYKDSKTDWYGEIPSHWAPLRIKLLLDKVSSGTSVNAVDTPAVEGRRGVLKTSCVYDGTFRPDENKAVVEDEINRVSCPVVKDRLIVSRMNTPDLVGAAGLVRSDYPNLFLPDRLWQIAFRNAAPDFVHYWTRTKAYRSQVRMACTGTSSSMQNLSQDQFGNFELITPPIEEQRSITAFLDHETAKIDTLIEKQQQLIKLLKEKRQAVISHAVTKGLNPDAPMKNSGVEWLGEVPEHWAVAKLGHRYQIQLGKMLDDKKISGSFLERYLRNTDVQWSGINIFDLPMMDFRPYERERYLVRKGDLLVCEGGEIGRCAIWDREETCFYQKALHRLRPCSSQSDSNRYMWYVLNDAVYRERFLSGAGKATIAHLPAETFRQYKFAFPPFEEQLAIVEYLDSFKSKLDKTIEKSEYQITLLQERRTALISAAVTGKIDVRNWKPQSSADKQEKTTPEPVATPATH